MRTDFIRRTSFSLLGESILITLVKAKHILWEVVVWVVSGSDQKEAQRLVI